MEDINGTERTTAYTYDKDNRTTSITTDNTTVDYTYDSFGRVTQQVTKNGNTVILTEVFEFNNPTTSTTSSQIKSYKTYKGTIADTNLIAQYSYTYDDNGNILTVSDGTNTTRYTYDSANQLTREDNQKAGKTYTWTYDNAGNILSHKTYAYTTEANLGTVEGSVNYDYNNAQWGDLLSEYNTEEFRYDEIGNPILFGDPSANPDDPDTLFYTWEHGRQLKTWKYEGITWTYTYNNAGLRTGRTNGTTTYKYIYDGSALVQMTKDGQNIDFTYSGGTPLTMKVGEDTYYYVTNIQGDVMALVDSTGATVVSYSYTAYGEVTVTGNNAVAALNPLTYRGYVYDSETGLYYLQSRYYDPTIGRFINADAFASTGQGILGNNMFAYCQNSPVMFVDSSGYKIELPEDMTEEQEEEYNRAIAYLKQSKTGRELIEKLDNSPTIFYVKFHDDGANFYSYESHTLYIDIDSGLVLDNNGGTMSAALCLAHEMGHAALHLDEKVTPSALINPFYKLANEMITLRKYEKPIAKELGEPIRKDYADGLYKTPMRDSTHHRDKIYPWWFYPILDFE